MGMQMEAERAIGFAAKHLGSGNTDCAALCLADARSCFQRGMYAGATGRALKSLAYSVGIFHADYRAQVMP